MKGDPASGAFIASRVLSTTFTRADGGISLGPEPCTVSPAHMAPHAPTTRTAANAAWDKQVALPKRLFVKFQFRFCKKQDEVHPCTREGKSETTLKGALRRVAPEGQIVSLCRTKRGWEVPSMLPLWSEISFCKTEHGRKVSFNIPLQPHTDPFMLFSLWH